MKLVNISISTLLVYTLLSEGASEYKIKLARSTREEEMTKSFSSFIGELYNKYSAIDKVVTVVIPENKSEIVTQISENLVNSLSKIYSVKSIDGYSHDFIEQWEYTGLDEQISVKVDEHLSDFYIVPINPSRKLDHFDSQLKYLERDYRLNHKARFISFQILTECESQSSQHIVKILNAMWIRNFFDSILITCYVCNGTVSVISARPFTSQNACRQVESYNEKYFKLSGYKDKASLSDFSYQTPKGFNHCPFWAGTTPIPPYVLGNREVKENRIHYKYLEGMDIEMMRLASSKLNFTYDFYPTIDEGATAWFLQLHNKTILGILQDAIEKKIDVVFGGIVPSYVSYYKYDYTPSYKFSAICWYVPGENEVSPWKILFLVYPLNVWIISAIIFLIVLMLYYIMSSPFAKLIIQNFCFCKRNFGHLFLNFFSISLGLSSSLAPKRIYLRILLLSWIIYCMNRAIIYQTVLFTFLTHPPMETEMNSLQDLEESGIMVSTTRLYIDLFRYIESDVLKSTMSNYIICEDTTTCFKDFIHNRNFSIMEKIEVMEYMANLKVSKIHRIEEKVLSYSVSFLFNKGNPLTEEFSKVLLRTFQAGFLLKWEQSIGWFYHDLINRDIQSDDDSIPLNLQDLAGAFSLLVLGLSASLLAFIGEEIFSRCIKTPG